MRSLAVLLLALACALAACVDDAPIEGAVVPERSEAPADGPQTAAPLASPDVVDTPCPDPPPPAEDVEAPPITDVGCGLVVLPEDRDQPDGPVVEVAFTRLDAQPVEDATASGDALVVLADGPGDPMTTEVGAWATSSLRLDRDIILLDARGAGRSFPSLDCGQPPAPGALPLDLVQDCHGELLDQGVDLRSYHTAVMAADVVDVVQALDLDGYHLLGIGHGARVALAVAAAAPPGLGVLVLDSPLPAEVDVYDQRPANAQAAVNRLLDECAQSSPCDRAFGTLGSDVERLVRALNRVPREGDVVPMITGDDLVRAALAAMRGADGPAAVPAALHLAKTDPAAALSRLQEAAVTGATVPTTAFSEGLRLSSDCRDELPFAGEELVTGGLDAVGGAVAEEVVTIREACGIWSVPPTSDRADQPVQPTVPTLVLTGEFDPLSPPAWGAAVAASTATGQIVQVDGAGHRVHDADNCTVAIVAEFLRRPRAEVNDACARDRVIDFVLS